MENKNILIGIGIIILALVIGNYFGFFAISESRNCNLGSWHVSSYDTIQKTLTIAYSSSGSSSGCIGTYDVSSIDKGGMNILTKEDCESFGLSWREEGVCLISDSWFLDKKVTSTIGGCTISCNDPRGCGGCGLAYGASRTTPVGTSFDGFSIGIGFDECSLGISQSCSGTIAVGSITNQTVYRFSDNKCSQMSILENSITSNDYLNQSACEKNIISEQTCSDGIKNQNETGIDCGGQCFACPNQVNQTQNNTECTTAITSSCSIGTIPVITTYACIDGKYIATGNQCEDGTSGTVNEETLPEKTTTKSSDKTIWIIFGIIAIIGIIYWRNKNG